MDGPNEPIILKTPDWLRDDHVQRVFSAISTGGNTAYFVGGCVRDALLGIAGGDVDVATDATPEEAVRSVEAAGLRAVPTGIDHGTITVVTGGTPVEVTSFRRDVRTDGRHAEVVFTREMSEDARRRDFTLNALYATATGEVIDPLSLGIADCCARRIRFIEDPAQRIREDYLRILRYFRFFAWYANPKEGFDPAALDAIARNLDGLETLSAERIGAEMMRLLAAPDPAEAVAAFAQTGGLMRILPGTDHRFLAPAIHVEKCLDLAPDPVVRLATLGGEDTAARLRLSRKASRHLEKLRASAESATRLAEIAYREGADIARGVVILRSAVGGVDPDPHQLKDISAAATAAFPVSAQDLMPAYQGKALGDRLRRLEDRWIASSFALSREELIEAG